MYIRQLSKETQNIIKVRLEEVGLEVEDIEMAMNSKITDLEDTINIRDIKVE